MISFFLKRMFQLFFVLFSISTIVFFLQRLIPGSPADTALGVDAAETDKILWLGQSGLLKPLFEQYLSFLWNLLHFDFGKSYVGDLSVSELILPRFWETIQLATVSFILSLLIATFVGIVSSVYLGTWIDKSTAVLSLLSISAPSFVIGPILIWIFAVKIDLFPISGSEDLSSFVLPSVTLGAAMAAFSSRMIRSGIVEVLGEDYIRTARSKGLPPWQVWMKHVLKNAFLPTLTILGLQLGVLLSGTVITEQIFNWPGLGSLLIESIQQREYNIVSGCVLIIAGVYVFCNLLVDILYHVLDPRIRIP
jgi:peptide/nickel transport system permease protein